nr:uncharacterized protein LOC129270179 [Lytechinus pictus]
MARGIFSSTKQAVAFFPTKSLRSSDIYDCVIETALALECAGLKVRGVTSDGASMNRKFYKMCGDQHHLTVHPLNFERPIYFFCDVPHLIKTTRNNLENSGFGRRSRNLQFRGRHIRWTHFLDLHSWDSRGDLRMLPKITDAHLYLTPSSRMRVKLASQVMSQSVANAMKARKLHIKNQFDDDAELTEKNNEAVSTLTFLRTGGHIEEEVELDNFIFLEDDNTDATDSTEITTEQSSRTINTASNQPSSSNPSKDHPSFPTPW